MSTRIEPRRPVRAALAAAALALACVVAGAAARADQTDVRLGTLFERLAHASDTESAMPVEAEIWRLWLESGNAAVDVLMRRGIAAMAAGELDVAIIIFGQVVIRAPRFAEGWNKRATAHYLNDDLDASVSDIRATLALEPRHFGALSGMGLIFLRTGDARGALSAFEAVLEVHPQSEGARERVQALRVALGTGA